MPEKETRKRAAADKKAGKAPSTQAGEYVREEMHHIREGKHGARNTKQAIAIGLSQARRDGVDLEPPKKRKGRRARRQTVEKPTRPAAIRRPRLARVSLKGTSSEATRKRAGQDLAAAHKRSKPSATRSKAVTKALKREPKSAASHASLSKHAKQTAAKRTRSAKKSR